MNNKIIIEFLSTREVFSLEYNEYLEIFDLSNSVHKDKFGTEFNFFNVGMKISNNRYLLAPIHKYGDNYIFKKNSFNSENKSQEYAILPLTDIMLSQFKSFPLRETEDYYTISFFFHFGIQVRIFIYDKKHMYHSDHPILLNYNLEILSGWFDDLKNPVYENFPFYDIDTYYYFLKRLVNEYPELVTFPEEDNSAITKIGPSIKYNCEKNILYLHHNYQDIIDIRSLEKLYI